MCTWLFWWSLQVIQGDRHSNYIYANNAFYDFQMDRGLLPKFPWFKTLRKQFIRACKTMVREMALKWEVVVPHSNEKVNLDAWMTVTHDCLEHQPHVHPYSVLSGVYYLATPPKAGAIRFHVSRQYPTMTTTPSPSSSAHPELCCNSMNPPALP